MKKTNGFIATSLLYSFFLIFVTLFIAMVNVYLQNRVYLTKFEDSSKNSICIREMKERLDISNNVYLYYNNSYKGAVSKDYNGTTFKVGSTEYNLSKCETLYSYTSSSSNSYIYVYTEGCTT